MRAYTFVCLAENQVAVHVETQGVDGDDYRAHGRELFRAHSRVAVIEVWQDETIVEAFDREGVRPWPFDTDRSASGLSDLGEDA